MSETWKPVVGYVGYYEVSDMGRVRSVNRVITEQTGQHKGKQYELTGQMLSACVNGRGYRVLNLSVNGFVKQFQVHRLVAAAFIGLCPEGQECNHLNGITTDNNLDNIEYVTASENMRHSIHVLGNKPPPIAVGENNPSAKLAADQVLGIRSRYAAGGVTQQDLADVSGISLSNINHIVNGRTWKHLLKEGGV